MKQWEDWIIFLGFEDREYDNTVTAVKKWNDLLAGSDLNKDNLAKLNKWLFSGTLVRIWHSCCLSFKSMHVTDDCVEAGWIDDGGLADLRTEYIKVENKEFSASYDNYSIRNLPVHFFNYEQYQVIGMTLDGKVVIDTFKEYGNREARRSRIRELGYRRYCEEFLETVKKNYGNCRLPPVPKGILKLPSAVRQGDRP